MSVEVKAVGYFVAGETELDPAGVRAQEGRFYQACDARGLRAVQTFTDTVQGPRPGFERLLRAVERSPSEFEVIVYDADRLGATHAERIERLLLLEGLGVRVTALSGGRGDLLERLVTAAAGGRRAAPDQERAREGLQRRALQGQGLGKPPFGYRIGPTGKLEVVPSEAETVRQIFHLYVNGLPNERGVLERLGLRMIAGYLNERGVLTRRGAHWSVVTVRDILKNRAYIGTYSRFGVRVANSHTAIISSDLFARAERLRARAAAPRRENSAGELPFLLSGLVVCGECGRRLIGATRRQGWTRKDKSKAMAVYRYYRCGSRVNQSVCGYHTRRAEDLEREVIEAVAARFDLPLAPDAPVPPAFLALRRRVLRSALAAQVREALLAHRPAGQIREQALPLFAEAPDGPDSDLPRWVGATPEARRGLLCGLLEKVVVYDDHIEPVFTDVGYE